MIDIFINDYPGMVAALRHSFEKADSDTMSRTAHSLKGMLRNFQADTAAEMAFIIEKKGEQGEFEGVDQVIEKLAAQLDEVAEKLQTLVKEISK